MTTHTDSYRNNLRYQGQDYRFTPTYLRKRDPIAPQNKSPDIRPAEQQGYYPVNSLWTNTTNENVWLLVGISNNLANWVQLYPGGVSGLVNIQTVGGLVSPVGGAFDFTNAGGNVSITTPGAGQLQFDVAPNVILNALNFHLLPEGSDVFPAANVVNLQSVDGSVTIHKLDGNSIDFSVAAISNAFKGLRAGGNNIDPDPAAGTLQGRVLIAAANNSVTIVGDIASHSITIDASPVLYNSLKININGSLDIAPTTSNPSKFLFTSSGGITLSGSGSTINFAGSGGGGGFGGLIGGSNAATAVPDGANKVTIASANNTVVVNGSGSTIDLNALPVLQNLVIDINSGADTILPTTGPPSLLKFTSSGSTVITKTNANTINFSSTGGGAINPASTLMYVDDFMFSSSSPGIPIGDLAWSASNTPFVLDRLVPLFSDVNHPGIRFSSGSLPATSTNGSGIMSSVRERGFTLGCGQVSINWLIYTGALSIPGSRYELRIGTGDNMYTMPYYIQQDGFYFEYSDILNAGRWVMTSVKNGVVSRVNTSVPVAIGWHILNITVNSTGTSVVYSIDNVAQTPITTNLTTSEIAPLYVMRAINQPLVDGVIGIDQFTMRIDLNNPRY